MIELSQYMKPILKYRNDSVIQEVITSTYIYIIGCGATGSHFISFLSQFIGNLENNNKIKLRFIDGDIVESRNLLNQKYLRKDIGKNKAMILSERYSSIYDLDIGYIDKFIDDNFIDIITKDLNNSSERYNISLFLISCVDNNDARRSIIKTYDNIFEKEYYKLNNVIYIDAGNSVGTDNITGQIVIGGKFAYCNKKIKSIKEIYPQVMMKEYDDKSISCGLDGIQNISANITSATNVFNVFNNIVSFNRLEGNLIQYNVSKLTQRTDTVL